MFIYVYPPRPVAAKSRYKVIWCRDTYANDYTKNDKNGMPLTKMD